MTDFDNARRQASAAGFAYIPIRGEINADTVAQLRREMPANGDLLIEIDSTGGDVASAWQVFDLLEAHQQRGRVATWTTARAESAGALLMYAASPGCALAHPNAQLVWHAIHIDGIPATLSADTQRWAQLIAKRTGWAYEEALRGISPDCIGVSGVVHDSRFTGAQAQRQGLVDQCDWNLTRALQSLPAFVPPAGATPAGRVARHALVPGALIGIDPAVFGDASAHEKALTDQARLIELMRNGRGHEFTMP
ncbi:MAG TPA: ATP-dependent Clp protease proteolytic subunit [Steroidobacteraceae bacterium]|jgi:ATP-dependent protease ClpP protease subunit